MNTNTVRVERFFSPLTVTTLSVKDAVKTYGQDELMEYAQGHHDEAAFFVQDEAGAPVYPVTLQSITP